MLGFMALRTAFKGPVARGLAPRGQYGFESGSRYEASQWFRVGLAEAFW